MFQSIVVGLDLALHDQLVADRLGESSAAALRRALWLASLTGAPVKLVSALDLSPKAQWLVEHAEKTQTTLLDAANRQLAKYVQQAQDRGIAASACAVIGRPWVVVLRQLAEQTNPLVVIGTHHRSHWAGILAGSMANKLLHKCPCRLWVVDPEDTEDVQRILVATDLSPVSEQLVDLAAEVACLAGAQLHLLHALDSQIAQLADAAQDAAQQLRDLERHIEHEAQGSLAQQAQRPHIQPLQVPPQVHLVPGDAATVIADYVQELEIQLLVMGTLSHSFGVPGMLMGTTAERVLSHIHCSLLTAKPAGFETPVNV